MKICYLVISAVLLCSTLSSCSKDDDVTTIVNDKHSHQGDKNVDLKPLRTLQSKGFCQSLILPVEKPLRSTSVESERDQEIFRAFLESPEALEAVQKSMGNPFLGLKALGSYNDLTERQKEIISLLSEDSTALEFYHETLRYLQTKGDPSLRSFVYSQLLYSGPQHAEGSKQSLKVAGIMALAAGATVIGTPVVAAIAAGASYLLSLW